MPTGYKDYSRSVSPQFVDRPGYANELMSGVLTMDEARTNAAVGTSKTVPTGKRARLTAMVMAWVEGNTAPTNGFVQPKLSITPSGGSITDLVSPVLGVGVKSDNLPPVIVRIEVMLKAGDKVEGRASGTNTAASSARAGISWFYEEWDA